MNPAVVFSAIKLIIKLLDYHDSIENYDFFEKTCKKISPALGLLIL